MGDNKLIYKQSIDISIQVERDTILSDRSPNKEDLPAMVWNLFTYKKYREKLSPTMLKIILRHWDNTLK